MTTINTEIKLPIRGSEDLCTPEHLCKILFSIIDSYDNPSIACILTTPCEVIITVTSKVSEK
jgi:hypothetical protein